MNSEQKLQLCKHFNFIFVSQDEPDLHLMMRKVNLFSTKSILKSKKNNQVIEYYQK